MERQLGLEEEDFSGAKIAILCDGHVLTYQRDAFDHIPFPGQWDLPGGGRENGESAEACALRELYEEFGLRLDPGAIVWRRRYEGADAAHYFMAAHVTADIVGQVSFGEEGQRWALTPIADFLSHANAVAHLQQRLRDYLESAGDRSR